MARKFAKPGREVRRLAPRLARLWPLCVGAVGILAVLGMAIWLLLPAPTNEQPATSLAQNQPVFERELAQTPPPSPPGAEDKKSAEMAVAEATQPSLAIPSRQLEMAPPLAAKDTAIAQDKRQAREEPASVAGAQLASGQAPANAQFPSTSGAPAPAPAGAVNDSLAARYGLAPGLARSAAMRPRPWRPRVAATPPAATVALAKS